MGETKKLYSIKPFLDGMKNGKTEMSNNKETPEVTELTEEEINIKSNRFRGLKITFFEEGANWAKSRSDEYWKQEIAKKVDEIELLKLTISNLQEKINNPNPF